MGDRTATSGGKVWAIKTIGPQETELKARQTKWKEK
jgi:hypothetical protein